MSLILWMIEAQRRMTTSRTETDRCGVIKTIRVAIMMTEDRDDWKNWLVAVSPTVLVNNGNKEEETATTTPKGKAV